MMGGCMGLCKQNLPCSLRFVQDIIQFPELMFTIGADCPFYLPTDALKLENGEQICSAFLDYPDQAHHLEISPPLAPGHLAQHFRTQTLDHLQTMFAFSA
jgi:hypothetical protein